MALTSPVDVAPVRPGSPGLPELAPALLGQRDRSWLPEPAASARRVVVLLLDGLGWRMLEERRHLAPELAAMAGGPLATVVPSTTATALTSLTTGLQPAEHGLVGYRFREGGDILNTLKWTRGDGRRPPAPFVVQRHSAFGGRPVPVVTRAEFRSTGFTEAHLHGARFVGWSTPAMLVEQVRRLVAERERLVYAYYPGVDAVAHEFGLGGGWLDAEVRFTDRLVGALLDVLPSDAALLVVADHGQVELPDGGWLPLQPLEPLVYAYGGEGRFRMAYARRGAAAELLQAAHAYFGDVAWVFSREQLLDEGWLGAAAPAPAVRRRLGDVALAARAPVAFADPTLPRETLLRGVHGSVTDDEMLVPLLAAPGRA